MPLQYAGGTLVYRDFDNGTVPATLDGIRDALLDAGWTQQSEVSAYNSISADTNPINGQTVTIGSVVYTFRSAINNATPYEVAVGIDVGTSLANLDAAINAGAGSGTLYSSATTAHPDVTSSTTLTTLTITSKLAGVLGNSTAACSESSNLAAWAHGNLYGGTTILRSAKTAAGLQCEVVLHTTTFQGWTDTAAIKFRSIDQSYETTNNLIYAVALRRLNIIANRYQFFVFFIGTFNVSGTTVAGGVPFLFPHVTSMKITGIDVASPIKIYTEFDHGLTTGASVYNADIQGVTGANGPFVITVTGSNQFTLDGSVGGGAWTPNTGRSAPAGKIARLIWSQGNSKEPDNAKTFLQTWRNNVNGNSGNNWGFSSILNGNLINKTNVNAAVGNLTFLVPTYGFQWYNNQFINAEPYIALTPTTDTATSGQLVAQIWDGVIVNSAYNGDILVSFDSRTWINFTAKHPSYDQNGALFLAIS